MDLANEKMGPCPTCLGVIKPCRCQVQAELDELKSKLRKVLVEMEEDYVNSHIRPVAQITTAMWRDRIKQIPLNGGGE